MELRNMTFVRLVGRSRYFLLAALIAVACGSAPLARAQADCKVVFDASYKLRVTPHHGYTSHVTQVRNGQQVTDVLEDISVGGFMYIKVHGNWRKSPMNVQELLKQDEENRKNARNVSCHHLRDEAVNGEAAGVYSAHAETDNVKSDSTVWISKSRGVILRQEEDVDVDGNKSHMSLRFDYANISAPAVSR